MRFLFLLLFAALVLPCPATAQDSQLNWRVARATLDRDLADELQELANWCRSAGLQSQVEPTFALYKKRDLGRMYVFPAQESLLQQLVAGRWANGRQKSMRYAIATPIASTT